MTLFRRNSVSKTTGRLLQTHIAVRLQQTEFLNRFQLSLFNVNGLALNMPNLQSLSDTLIFE